MGRKPRILAPGAVYHVYNRVSSGEAVFGSPETAEEFLRLLVEVKEQDGWAVLAWCLMANHYHVVVRSGEVPLSRGMHRLQNLFSRWFNRRAGRTGPLWQSRYHAKVVRDESYLWQLILYVHLNPVRAGAVGDPVEYGYSGHGEIVKRGSSRIVDRDQALLCFGTARRGALRRYRLAVETAVAEITEGSLTVESNGQLNEEPDAELWFDPNVPYLDALGRSSIEERPEVTARAYLGAACEELGVEWESIRSRLKDRRLVRARRMMAALAVERWGLRSGLVAAALGRPAQQVSVWAGEGTRLRGEDAAFREQYESLDGALKQRLAPRQEPVPGTNL